MQGFGLQVDPTQAGTPAFQKALMAVLTDPQYTKAAKAMSVKIRARKNTPVQEAAGVPACSWLCDCASQSCWRQCLVRVDVHWVAGLTNAIRQGCIH